MSSLNLAMLLNADIGAGFVIGVRYGVVVVVRDEEGVMVVVRDGEEVVVEVGPRVAEIRPWPQDGVGSR